MHPLPRALVGLVLVSLGVTASATAAPRSPAPPAPTSLTAANPFDAQWWGGFALPIRNAGTSAIIRYGGQLIVGGGFTQAGTTPVHYVAEWTGLDWQALGNGPPGPVEALAVYAGLLVAAGSGQFFAAGEQPMISMWDGAQWTTIGSPNGTVHALATYAGELYAGGDFTSVNGVPASHIARWDGIQWHAVGAGISGVGSPFVKVLTVLGSQLVAAGKFSGSIAAWDGASWSILGSGLQVVGIPAEVNGLTVIGTDLYAAGRIDHAGATPISNVAKWNGSSWVAVGTDNAIRNAIGQWNGQAVGYINFPTGLASWTGTTWQSLSGPAGFGAFAFYNDGTALYANGGLNSAGNPSAVVDGFIRYDGVSWTSLAQPWAPSMSGLAASEVTDLLAFNGELYAAMFGGLAGAQDHFVSISKIGRWNGSAWTTLPVGLDLPNALGTYGGSLIAADAHSAGVRQLNGSAWTTLGSTGSPSNRIMGTAEDGADLVAVGYFTSIGGAAANGVARWKGTAWSAVGSGVDGGANSVISYGGQVVVGGPFTSTGGTPAQHIVSWDGSAFHELGGGTDGEVTLLAHFGSDLVVGGSFTHAGGVACSGAALWNGSTWSALGDNVHFTKRFREHAGRLYAVGEFVADDNSVVDGAALWTGERWLPLGSGIDRARTSGVNGVLTSLEFLGDDLYIGGAFAWANGKASFNIARLPDPFVTGVGDTPHGTRLSLVAGPNPSRGTTRFTLSLPSAGHVRLTVHDVSGRLVALLADEDRAAGTSFATWAGHAAPGIYLATVEAGGAKRTTRVIRFD